MSLSPASKKKQHNHWSMNCIDVPAENRGSYLLQTDISSHHHSHLFARSRYAWQKAARLSDRCCPGSAQMMSSFPVRYLHIFTRSKGFESRVLQILRTSSVSKNKFRIWMFLYWITEIINDVYQLNSTFIPSGLFSKLRRTVRLSPFHSQSASFSSFP